MLDKIPFDFIRHKSKTALKRNHSKILVASRYTFQKQPCIIKHNCLFHTVFIKPFVTFLVETAFIIFNCKLSIFFATLSVIIVTQQKLLIQSAKRIKMALPVRRIDTCIFDRIAAVYHHTVSAVNPYMAHRTA